jgi:hypothetical protein
MSIPEKFNDKPTEQPLDGAPLRADNEVIEIAADVLEHVVGGTGGGGGVGNNN